MACECVQRGLSVEENRKNVRVGGIGRYNLVGLVDPTRNMYSKFHPLNCPECRRILISDRSFNE